MGFIKSYKRKYKGNMVAAGRVCWQREHAFLFSGALKTYTNP
jgi:hypothetical protein